MYGNENKGPVRIYQADAQWSDQVLAIRRQLAGICEQCINRTVRIQTIDGSTYEGKVIGQEGSLLFLAASDQRFLAPYASSFILPLVLFDLLAITLLI
ncbi:MAG: hypothetical protein JWR03_3117 [Cohnella sp.]|nr:hypothetical protein [Cohnella sp.]